MTCTHCGRGGDTADYELRFAPPGGDEQVLELSLCSDCLADFLLEPGVEIVA